MTGSGVQYDFDHNAGNVDVDGNGAEDENEDDNDEDNLDEEIEEIR